MKISSSNINWKKFKGEELNVLFNINIPLSKEIVKYVNDFERLTGIKVRLEFLPENEYMQEIFLNFPYMEYDLIQVPMGHWGYICYKKGILDSLDEFLYNKSLTDLEWYDLKDFYEQFLHVFIYPEYKNGQIYAIPLTFEIYVLFYRKDILNQKEIHVTNFTTLETWLDLLPNLYVKKNGLFIYPAVIRGGGSTDIIDPLNSMLLQYLGNINYDYKKYIYFDSNNRLNFNNPIFKEVFCNWAKIMKYCPPNIVNYTWYDAYKTFRKGEAVTYWYDAHLFAPLFERFKLKGKVGYTIPLVNNNRNSAFWCWGLGILKKTSPEKKKAAWLLIEWLTSKEVYNKVAPETYTTTRTSIFNSKKFIKNMPQDLAFILRDVFHRMKPSLVYYEDFDFIIFKIINKIHKIFRGENPDKVIDELQKEVKDIYF
ncbi:Erythritol/L-threitol-binding protein [archaeon HR06]|nr:Erythritol/L-threitol-binding protein [archaeon HR06]